MRCTWISFEGRMSQSATACRCARDRAGSIGKLSALWSPQPVRSCGGGTPLRSRESQDNFSAWWCGGRVKGGGLEGQKRLDCGAKATHDRVGCCHPPWLPGSVTAVAMFQLSGAFPLAAASQCSTP